MANWKGLVCLLQNYPLYSISTTSKRYERDRHDALVNRRTARDHQCNCNLNTNALNVSPNNKTFERIVTNETIKRRLISNNHLPPMRLSSSKLSTSVAQFHGASNNNNNMPNTNKQQFLTTTNNNHTINSLVKQQRNVQRMLTIMIIAFISLANVHNEARMILCDKVSDSNNNHQTASGLFWNEAQTVQTSSPTINQQQQQQSSDTLHDTNVNSVSNTANNNNNDNNNDNDNNNNNNNEASISRRSFSTPHTTIASTSQQKASLTNQLLLLLSHPFINNDNNNQHNFYQHQQFDNNDKLLQNRNSLISNNNNNHQHDNNNNHNNYDSLMPVTTSPITATLMAPNLFQSVTPPSFATAINDQQSTGQNRLLQDDEFEAAAAANLLANNQQLESLQQQSDLAMAMSEFNPSLVFSVKDQALDVDHAPTAVEPSFYEKQQHHSTTSPMQFLPFLDRDAQYTSGVQESNSWPMVARNSVVTSATNEIINNSPASATADNNKQPSSRVARKLRSLHEKTNSLHSKHASLSPNNKNLAKPRGVMWEMATDTSLGVTLLHMMDRASFALPLGKQQIFHHTN